MGARCNSLLRRARAFGFGAIGVCVALAHGSGVGGQSNRPTAIETCATGQGDAQKDCADLLGGNILESSGDLPKSRRFYERLGKAAEAAGRLDLALLTYRHATRVFPQSEQFAFALGEMLASRYDAAAEAMGCFLEAVRRDPESTRGWRGLGTVQLRLGRSAEALSSFDRALSISPAAIDAMTGRALALVALGRTSEAIRALKALRPTAARDPVILGTLGRALLTDGQPEAALEVFDSLAGIGNAWHRLAFCGRAKAFAAMGSRERAADECRRAMNRRPSAGPEPCDCEL